MKAAWPNLYLVGAPKAATTYLHDLLMQSYGVFTAENKEPAFFHWGGEVPVYKNRPSRPTYACLTEAEYLANYAGATGTERWIIDASTHYLSTPAAADRIKAKAPAAKIVAVLREPLGRAWSHYLMGRRDGFVLDAPEAALARELAEMKEPDVLWSEHYRFIRRSLYLDGLTAYLHAFGPANVRVYMFEDVAKELPWVLEDLGAFLDLDLTGCLAASERASKNAHAENRFPRATAVLQRYRESGLRTMANKVVPRGVRDVIRTRIQEASLKEAPPQAMPDEVRRVFAEHLLPDWEASQALITETGVLHRAPTRETEPQGAL